MLRRRLWWRLFLSFLWVPVFALLLMGVYGAHVIRGLYLDQMYGDLESRARLCSMPLGDLLSHGETPRIDPLCKKLLRVGGARITVVLPSGQVIGDSDEMPSDMDNHGHRPEILDALAGGVGHSQRYSSTEHEQRVYVAVPLVQEGATVAVVRASLPLTALTRALAVVRDRIVVAMLIAIALHAMTTLVISRRMSRPLEEMKSGAERFATGDLRHRLRVVDAAEVGALATAMNRMAEQLDERIQTVLCQQNEREAMLSSMEEGVLAISDTGAILSLNDACAALLGEEKAKLQGRSVYEAIRKADLLRFIEAALASTVARRGRASDSWPAGSLGKRHGTALHDSQRGKIGVLIVLHDVTRLRHLEDVRRDFVANVSHELRTPITSIKGFVETLVDGAFDDKDNARRFLQITLRQVNRLDAIISDLLTLSRIERGSEAHTIEVAPEGIRAALQAAVEMCEKTANQKGVRMELDCPEDLTAEINVALLEQAVVNLLDNAIKYSNDDGVIEILAAVEGEELTIRVADHGCGIEPQHLARLFERFYRVDKARSRELGGTGLGLAIVRHIALAHRGSARVESTVGVGTTFCLRLPIRAESRCLAGT